MNFAPLRRLTRLQVLYSLHMEAMMRGREVLLCVLNPCLLRGKGGDGCALAFREQIEGSLVMFEIVVWHNLGALFAVSPPILFVKNNIINKNLLHKRVI
jgi:hypothetical protein